MNASLLEEPKPAPAPRRRPRPWPRDLEPRFRVAAHLLVEQARQSGLQSFRRCRSASAADAAPTDVLVTFRTLERELAAADGDRARSQADVLEWLRQFAALRDRLALSARPAAANLAAIASACLAALE